MVVDSSPIRVEKQITAPARIPGAISGSVILKKVVPQAAPAIAEASSTAISIWVKDAMEERNIYGMRRIKKPITIIIHVPVSIISPEEKPDRIATPGDIFALPKVT